jgi:cytochrome c biogenesis protein CcmG/thiol:disulfide interchange protein DsbE
MRRISLVLIPLFLFLLLVIFLYLGLQADPRKLPSPLVNKPVPVFDLPNLFSDESDINDKELHGQIILLNVWATWCHACREEHLLLTDIVETYKDKIKIYGLNYKDQKNAAVAWLSQLGNPYTKIIYDFQGKLAMDLGVYGTPETFLIDQQGIIRYKHAGPLTLAVWQKEFLPEIEKLNARNH